MSLGQYLLTSGFAVFSYFAMLYWKSHVQVLQVAEEMGCVEWTRLRSKLIVADRCSLIFEFLSFYMVSVLIGMASLLVISKACGTN